MRQYSQLSSLPSMKDIDYETFREYSYPKRTEPEKEAVQDESED